MNKLDLINKVSKISGLSKTKSSEVVDATITTIQDALSNGEKVTLAGFGTWETSVREARIGRNPQTGQEISIASKRVAKFKVGSTLAKQVNG
jgi:DNA-binding protein HU-beta